MSRHWLALSARNSLTPFLYQTSTLSSTSLLHRRAAAPFRSSYSSTSKPSNLTSAEDSGQANPAPKARRSYLQRRAVSVPKSSGDSKSSKTPSMTRSEKRVFRDLLQQIGAGQEKPSGPYGRSRPPERSDRSEPPNDRTEETLEERPVYFKTKDIKERDQISWIFNSVLEDVRKRKPKPEGRDPPTRPAPTTFDAQTAEAMVEDEIVPRSVYDSGWISEALSRGQLSMERAIDLTVKRESIKTTDALRASVAEDKGDRAIWDVCKERIFSLLPLLESTQTADPEAGVGADPDADAAGADTTLAPSDSTTDRTASSLAEFFDLPPEIPVKSVVTALYPWALLTAFRILNLHFPQSQLIGQFHKFIKSRGRASMVLGASTPLYAEMIHFYWMGCRDLPKVIDLLKEMEVVGVEPDRRMCGLLGSIIYRRKWDVYHMRQKQERQGTKRREPWWDLAPNRMAVRELIGEQGWIHKFEKRVEKMQEQERIRRQIR